MYRNAHPCMLCFCLCFFFQFCFHFMFIESTEHTFRIFTKFDVSFFSLSLHHVSQSFVWFTISDYIKWILVRTGWIKKNKNKNSTLDSKCKTIYRSFYRQRAVEWEILWYFSQREAHLRWLCPFEQENCFALGFI